MTSTGYRCPLYALPTDDPSQHDQHEDHPNRSANVTAPSLHVNSGKHKELPRFEADSAVRFFARHLGRSITSLA
jgi:hypothetical protein